MTPIFRLMLGLALLCAPAAHAGESRDVAAQPQRRMGADELRSAVERAVRARMPWTTDAVRFDQWRGPDVFEGPARMRRLQVRFAPGEDFVGRVTVELELLDPDQPELRGPRRSASIDVNVQRNVVVAGSDLRRGATLDAESLRVEPRALEYLPEGVLTEIGAASGQRTRVRVAKGAPLLASYLDAPDLVRRGDVIAVHAGEGALALRLEAKALEGGRSGEWIRAENPTSRRSFMVQITGRGVARMARGGERVEP